MCWGKLYDFHVFYEMVENVHLNHRPEMEVMTVKTEAVGLDSLPDQALDEVPFSTDLISTKQTEANYNSDHSEYDNEFDMGELQPFKEEESEHSDPFEIVTTSPKRNTSEPIEKTDENIRLTRYQRKSMVDIKEGDESSVEIKVIKRGRKRKEKETTDSEMPEIKPKKAGCKDKANKNSEEESAYKCKMKSFDNEISQYMGLHCDVCNVAVDNFAGLKTHMRSEHNIDNGYVKCCDKKFHKRANLLYHIRKHVDPNCYR